MTKSDLGCIILRSKTDVKTKEVVNMIKNFIFDLGNVLVDYNPMRCILKYVRNISDANYIASAVFESEEWKMLDKGEISYAEALDIWKEKVPERLFDSVREVVENFHLYLPENPEMTEILKKLSEGNKKIYVLSNVGERYPEIVNGLEFMKYVNGAVLSYEEKLLKPDPEIYARLIRRYFTEPSETVFIDDMVENVAIAKKFGMAGYVYDGDGEKLYDTFENLGFFEPLA